MGKRSKNLVEAFNLWAELGKKYDSIGLQTRCELLGQIDMRMRMASQELSSKHGRVLKPAFDRVKQGRPKTSFTYSKFIKEFKSNQFGYAKELADEAFNSGATKTKIERIESILDLAIRYEARVPPKNEKERAQALVIAWKNIQYDETQVAALKRSVSAVAVAKKTASLMRSDI